MYRKSMKGSLTVFAAISFMLIAQMIFVLIESARYIEMDKITKMQSSSELESVFAEFCKPLWDEYHILGADFASDEISSEIIRLSQIYNAVDKTTLVRNSAEEFKVNRYEVLTDAKGRAFAAQVCNYMKKNITYEMARKLYNNFNATKEMTESREYKDSSIDDAVDALKSKDKPPDSKVAMFQTTYLGAAKTEDEQDSVDLERINTVKSKGILKLILGSDTGVSGKKIDAHSLVSKRALKKGINVEIFSGSWMDKVLLEQYSNIYMSNYISPKKNRALDYEYEYLIAGKSSDLENLKTVVTEILCIREVANSMFLMSDPEKSSEALAVASAMGGITLSPELIPVIKAGIIAAWAYCESILDLRALMKGKKIPLIKSRNTWTSNLSAINKLLDGSLMAKTDEHGVDYANYMGFLYMLKSEQTMSLRIMDMQEKTINLHKDYENIKMDNLMCSSVVEIKYEYSTLFSDFVSLISKKQKNFKLKQIASYAYF